MARSRAPRRRDDPRSVVDCRALHAGVVTGGAYSPGSMRCRQGLEDEALVLLRRLTDDVKAEFRSDQFEAILKLVRERGRVLLVQRTGWGKSAVYFIATRLLRDRGLGPTLLVSPLLALMRNQIEAAERLGVRAVTINSSTTDEWEEVEARIEADEVDVLLISPERLANQKFRSEVMPVVGRHGGLLVIDEAHCISDWGHDFRPDYRRLVRILDLLPKGVPVQEGIRYSRSPSRTRAGGRALEAR